MNSLAKQIKELLQQNSNDEIVQKSLNAFGPEASSTLISTDPLPLEHVKRVSRIRAKINSERSGFTEGVENLLNALNDETEEFVRTHAFDSGNDVFTIFTNSSTTKLLGVLISKDKSITNY